MACSVSCTSSRVRRKASTDSFAPGFYRALDAYSSADIDVVQSCPSPSTLRLATGSDELPAGCFLVERLISMRKQKGKTEYLVLWEGYPKEDASWTPAQNITSAAIRSFESPTPGYRLIADATSNFKAAVQRSLKSGVNCNNRIDFEFRVDVFRYLFNGRGRNPPSGRGLFYELEDFDTTYFSDDWYIVYDKLGDGCTVDFPIRLESKIKWSTQVFCSNGSVKPKVFTEMISVTLVKQSC